MATSGVGKNGVRTRFFKFFNFIHGYGIFIKQNLKKLGLFLSAHRESIPLGITKKEK
jgi:hypothetical protein